jgi:predicted transcriptional regulator
MKLETWLESTGVTVEKFAESIDHKPVTIYRYMAGKRLPREDTFRKIYTATDGKVTPNDFLDCV